MSAPAVVRYHDGSAWRVCVLLRSLRTLHLVIADDCVRYKQVPLEERRYMRELTHDLYPYPVKRAAKLLLERIKRTAGTARAKKELRELLRAPA